MFKYLIPWFWLILLSRHNKRGHTDYDHPNLIFSIKTHAILAPSSGLLIVRRHIELLEFVLGHAPSGSIVPEAGEASERDNDECTHGGKHEETMGSAVVGEEACSHGSKRSGSDVAVDASSTVHGSEHHEVGDLKWSEQVCWSWLVHKDWERWSVIRTVHFLVTDPSPQGSEGSKRTVGPPIAHNCPLWKLLCHFIFFINYYIKESKTPIEKNETRDDN